MANINQTATVDIKVNVSGNDSVQDLIKRMGLASLETKNLNDNYKNLQKTLLLLTPGTKEYDDRLREAVALKAELVARTANLNAAINKEVYAYTKAGESIKQANSKIQEGMYGIQTQAQYLITELPNLAQSPMLFMRAIGNNFAQIGMEMQRTGQGIGSVFASLVKGLAGPLGIITLVVTLTTVIASNWDSIKNWISGLFNAGKEVKYTAQIIEQSRSSFEHYVGILDRATSSTKDLSAATIFLAKSALNEMKIAQAQLMGELEAAELVVDRLSRGAAARTGLGQARLRNAQKDVESLKTAILDMGGAITSADMDIRVMQIDLDSMVNEQSNGKIIELSNLFESGSEIARKISEKFWDSLPRYIQSKGRSLKEDNPFSLVGDFDLGVEEFRLSADEIKSIYEELMSLVGPEIDKRETAGGLFNRLFFGGDPKGFGDELVKTMKLTEDGFQALTQLANTNYQNKLDEAELDGIITKEEEKNLKKAWKQKQAFDIAAATTSGLLSIANAAATIPFFPMGLIQSGVAAAMMAANIAQIKSVKMPGFEGANGGSSSLGSFTPNVNIDNSGIAQNGFEDEIINRVEPQRYPTQVVVVDDISSALSQQRVKVSESVF